MRYDALIEDEPAGRPVSVALPLPLAPAVAKALALALIPRLAAAHAAGRAVVGLRPELIYVSDAGELTGVAPRAEQFWPGAEQPCYGVPPAFAELYLAPEVLAVHPAGPAADVFSLAAIVAHWITGQHPFGGDSWPRHVMAIAAGARRPWEGPEAWRGVIDAALAATPAERPSLAELERRLRAL